jgi:hypothetical protein
MAVFQRTEHRTENATPLETGFTFNRFEKEISVLDGMLRVGGLFFIDESDFAFDSTAVASRYVPLDFRGNCVVRERPMFDRENRLLGRSSPFTRAFVKKC